MPSPRGSFPGSLQDRSRRKPLQRRLHDHPEKRVRVRGNRRQVPTAGAPGREVSLRTRNWSSWLGPVIQRSAQEPAAWREMQTRQGIWATAEVRTQPGGRVVDWQDKEANRAGHQGHPGHPGQRNGGSNRNRVKALKLLLGAGSPRLCSSITPRQLDPRQCREDGVTRSRHNARKERTGCQWCELRTRGEALSAVRWQRLFSPMPWRWLVTAAQLHTRRLQPQRNTNPCPRPACGTALCARWLGNPPHAASARGGGRKQGK